MRSSAQLRRTFVAIFIGLLVATVAEAESFQETMEKAKSGDAEAQGQLGLIYQDGKGVPQDFVQAHAWFSVASANGNAAAVTERNELAKRMWPNQIARAQQLVVEFPQKYKLNIPPAVVTAPSAPLEPSDQTKHKSATANYARSGPYVGLGSAGAVYTDAAEADEKFLASIGYFIDVKNSVPVGLDLQVGYRFHPRAASQVHLQYLPKADIEWAGVKVQEADSLTLTADMKGYLLIGRIQPYALAGLGFMHIDFEDKIGVPAAFDFSDTFFAIRLGGGIDYYWTENIVLDVELGGILTVEDPYDLNQFTFAFGMQYRF